MLRSRPRGGSAWPEAIDRDASITTIESESVRVEEDHREEAALGPRVIDRDASITTIEQSLFVWKRIIARRQRSARGWSIVMRPSRRSSRSLFVLRRTQTRRRTGQSRLNQGRLALKRRDQRQ